LGWRKDSDRAARCLATYRSGRISRRNLPLIASVPGADNSYQWFRHGAALSGQTQGSLLIANASADDAGSYTAVVTNSAGSSTTNAATVRVSPAASRLVNMALSHQRQQRTNRHSKFLGAEIRP
jgi:hypothetical protein